MVDAVDRIIDQWGQVHPDLDVSAMGVIGRLGRLTRIYDRQLQRVFAQFDLQPGEFDVLATLRRADPEGAGLSAGELAAQAMITAGAMTNRADRLVAKGLISREAAPDSRRSVRICLTETGKTLIDEALLEHVANEENLLSSLSAGQREELSSLLRQLLLDPTSQV